MNTIIFHSKMNTQNVDHLIEACIREYESGANELNLHLDSDGTNMIAALKIYSFVVNSPLKLHIHNAGCVSSFANLLFLSGCVRSAGSDSVFHFSSAETSSVNGPYENFSSPCNGFERCQRWMVHQFFSRTHGIKRADWKYVHAESRELNAEEAWKCGYVDIVYDFAPNPKNIIGTI